jgi:small subunit ribosomal protein S17
MPRKIKTGEVVSDKMMKTIVVEVKSFKSHPLYKKTIRTRRRFMAHDENKVAKVGDIVRIVECRPYSKRKTWVLDSVISKGKQKEEVAAE